MYSKERIEEILYYNHHIQDYYQNYEPQGIYKTRFCQEKNLSLRLFERYCFQIVYKKINHPEFYAELVQHAEQYKKTKLTKKEYAALHNIRFLHLDETVRHLEMLQIIENNKDYTAPKPAEMAFVPVKASVPAFASPALNSSPPPLEIGRASCRERV